MLYLAVVVGCFVLLAGPVTRMVASGADISYSVKPSCSVGQALALEIEVRRPPLLRGNIELTVVLSNVLIGTSKTVPVTIAPARGEVEHFSLPVDTSCVGRVGVEVREVRLIDILGFSFTCLADAGYVSSFTVYPCANDIEVVTDRASRMTLSGLVFDRYRPGQDLSEVFDLRDFHDGDSLRAIHWKLSARADDLMVRIPSHPADFDLAVLFGVYGGKTDLAELERINAAASLTASLSGAFLRNGLGHTVVHRRGSGLVGEPVDTQTGFNAMLDTVLSTRLPVDPVTHARTFASFQAAHGISKLVLVTDSIVDSLFSELAALCDLTVLYVGEEGEFTVDESDGFVLMRISADAVNSKIKSLEL